MNRDELDLVRQIVEDAYRSKDYVNWIFVKACESVLENENTDNINE